MRIEWVNKKGDEVVVVFFNGWGMDTRATSHLENHADLLVLYDYRTLNTEELPSLEHYKKVFVIAWSMGVWAAAQILPEWNINPSRLIALNGTECPVDDRFGIPEKMYVLTENGMDERGKEKFFQRMLSGREERTRFSENQSGRELPEQVEELKAIHTASCSRHQCLNWDKVFISEKDVIFPAGNQHNWWEGKAPVKSLACGHYPFYCFRSWEDIIEA